MILFCIFLEKMNVNSKQIYTFFCQFPIIANLFCFVFSETRVTQKMPKFLSSIWTSIIEYETPRLVRIHNRKLGLVRRLIQFSIGTVNILRKHIFILLATPPPLCKYRQIHRNCPQRKPPSQNGGSASRIHQHTAQKRGVRLQNPSTKGGVRLQISSTRWGSASRIHQHTAPKWESASRIHQHQPKNGSPPLGTISMDPRYVSVKEMVKTNPHVPVFCGLPQPYLWFATNKT